MPMLLTGGVIGGATKAAGLTGKTKLMVMVAALVLMLLSLEPLTPQVKLVTSVA